MAAKKSATPPTAGSPNRKREVLIAAALTSALGLGAAFEGMRTQSYADLGGVWTICAGHTKDVGPGQLADAETCRKLLRQDMGEALDQVLQCIKVPLTPGQLAAFTDAVYNIGPRVVCGSTLQKKANAGDLMGACDELGRWVYVKGKVVGGLQRRRAEEIRLCKSDADASTPRISP